MKRYNKILAVVFALLLIFLMIPVLPGTAYADEAETVQAAAPKDGVEITESAPPLSRADRRLERIINRTETEAVPETRSSEIGSIVFSHKVPAAATYAWVTIFDKTNYPMDPNDIKVTWYYQDGSGWDTIPEIPSDIGEHAIIVPGYALGSKLKIVAEPANSSVTGSATLTTSKVVSSHLDYIDVYALGTGYYVGNEIDPYAFYEANGDTYYIDETYIWFDYYAGEGNSWTQFPSGVYNWYSYIPFEAEGKYLKVVAHVMADQEDVLGGPCTWISDERAWVLPLEDNFHDETLPSGWAVLDLDDYYYNWESQSGTDTLSLSGNDGDCIASASWVSGYGAVTPDNWLISPSFYVPKDATLEFYVSGSHYNDYKEKYAVYISTDVGLDVGTWTQLYTGTTNTYNAYVRQTVSLSAYAGKNVHIAFRHFDCYDQYKLLLDGVSIDSKLVRIAGKNRYDTSIDLANRFLSIRGRSKTELIFVTTGDNFPDALSGSSISTAFDAPVLLISPKQKSTQDKALNYIENHVSLGVILLGGTGAVPQEFEDRLNELASDPNSNLVFVERVSGKDRYKTNLEILERVYDKTGSDCLLVCDGTNWPDAATSSAVGLPVMLVGKNGLTAEQKSFLNTKTKYNKLYIYVIGGKGAVSDEVLNQLAPYDYYGSPYRLSGKDRARTAVEVAKFFVGEYNVETAVLAYGGNFPDCIAGGLLAYSLDAPILYADATVNSNYFKADDPYFQTNEYMSKAFILGGKTLISDDFALALLAKG